jgi:hypothetical protein
VITFALIVTDMAVALTMACLITLFVRYQRGTITRTNSRALVRTVVVAAIIGAGAALFVLLNR